MQHERLVPVPVATQEAMHGGCDSDSVTTSFAVRGVSGGGVKAESLRVHPRDRVFMSGQIGGARRRRPDRRRQIARAFPSYVLASRGRRMQVVVYRPSERLIGGT